MNKMLIDIEAKMVFIKHKIEWLEGFIESRRAIRDTGTGNHYPQVDDRVIEIATEILKENKEKLKKAEKQYGKNPFSEWLYSQIKTS